KRGRKRRGGSSDEEEIIDHQTAFENLVRGGTSTLGVGTRLPLHVHTGSLGRRGVYRYFRSLYLSSCPPTNREVREAVGTWLVTADCAAGIVKALVRHGRGVDVRGLVCEVLRRASVGDGGGIRGTVEGLWNEGEGRIVVECLKGKVGAEGYAHKWIKGCMGIDLGRAVWEGVREAVRRERQGREGEGWEWGKGERVYKRNEIVLW
ncbi:hypothetical protein TrRE_jg1193, partial [Triparma retinervis]